MSLPTTNRPSLDSIYMSLAEALSKRSTCCRGAAGCVVTVDDRIVSTGYNGSPPKTLSCQDRGGCVLSSEGNCLSSIHAEQNAIAFAAKKGLTIDNSIVYITMTPCLSCAKLLVAAGVKKVIYKDEYRILDGLRYLDEYSIQTVKLGHYYIG